MNNVEQNFLDLFLEEAEDLLRIWEGACLALEQNVSHENLNALFRSAHSLKGASLSIGLTEFGEYVHHFEDTIADMKNEKIKINASVISALLDSQVFLVKWVEGLRKDADYKPDTISALEKFKSSVVGEIKVNDETKVPREIKKNSENKINKPSPVRRMDESIRVSSHKIDSLIHIVGELSIQQAIINRARQEEQMNLETTLEALDLSAKIIRDLQQASMSLRMQPLERLFLRLERVVRDIAHQQKKEIKVVFTGRDIEIDNVIAESIKDPLIHLLHNAVDHGVESKEDRLKAGKPEQALLQIEALASAGGVTLKISDDGRGINKKNVRNKAIEKGIISAEREMSDEEIHQLILLPGFSTASAVTDISGRGIGMDVVHQTINELRGSLRIQSKEGEGTSFIINLPSSISVIDALAVRVGDANYAVPIQDIKEVINLSDFDIQRSTREAQIFSLRESVLPLKHLYEFLPCKVNSDSKFEKLDKNDLPKTSLALVVENSGQLLAFQIDSVMDEQSIIVRQLDNHMRSFSGLSGMTVLANGEPSLILNLPSIAGSYLRQIVFMRGKD